MTGAACPEDLLVHQGRDDLSADETHALQAHLSTCALCRMSASVGRAVGPLPPVDDQDQAMALRLVEHQMKSAAPVRPLPRMVPLPQPSRSNRWRLSRTVAIAAGVLLMASVASAAYWTVHVRAARQAAAVRAQAAAAVPTKTAPRHAIGAPVGATPSPVAPVAPAPVLALVDSPPAPTPVPAVRVSEHATAVASLDPEALLSGANEARRARHIDEAIRDYRALQARFPTSREAVLSHLSLGNLYLAQGAFADAVAQFQSYIHGCEVAHGCEAAPSSAAARGDGTGLAEEALLGEARALAALGRADDERAVWRTLEARFPRSEYLWRARQRLHELDRGATP